MPTAKPINRSDYGLPTSVSGVPGGLDLAPPLTPGCSKCGAKPKRNEDGHLAMKLDKDRWPVCEGCR